MILYILLIVFAGLMTLICLGLTIGGLVKNKRNFWIGGLIGFVIFSLLSVFSGYLYLKESLNYMGSAEFQEETRKKAENMGKTWGSTVSGTAQGLESTLDEEAIEKLAHKGSKIIGKGIVAIAKGADETTGKTTIFSDESIDKAGITVGRAEQIADSVKNTYGVFLEFKNDFDGILALTAFDSGGQKQDITELPIKTKAGKAKVYLFQFEYFKPGISGYCILAKK